VVLPWEGVRGNNRRRATRCSGRPAPASQSAVFVVVGRRRRQEEKLAAASSRDGGLAGRLEGDGELFERRSRRSVARGHGSRVSLESRGSSRGRPHRRRRRRRGK
ncbi:unnamed protein product, partial [Ectocarpus sp. 12 AP-2014]